MSNQIDFIAFNNKDITKNKFKQFKKRIKKSIFDLLLFLLKYNPLTRKIEIILVIIQLLQLLAYAFDEKFRPLWKNNTVFDVLKVIFGNFKIIPLFQGDTELYLLFFYFLIIFILTILFILLIIAIRIPKKKIKAPILIQMLSTLVPIMSTILFVPIAETLLSIFICKDGINPYGKNLQCWVNEYIFHCIMSGITLIAFILYSFLIQNTYFELKYNQNGYSSKKTLLTDNILLYNKMIIIIGIKVVYTTHASAFILALIGLCMCYLSYCYTSISPYYYYEVQKCYLLMSYMVTWSFVILFLSQLTINSNFNGNMALCIIGYVIIFFGVLMLNKKPNYSLILKSPMHLNSGDEAISKIEELFTIIYANEGDRIGPLILFGYVSQYRSTVIKDNDPMHKVTDNNDKSNLLHLITHIHSLYLNALSKFPNDVRLRIFYAIFIFDCLNKRDQALFELDIAMGYDPIFSFEFIIYRLREVFESSVCNGNVNTFSSEMSEIATTLAYKNLYSDFKKTINKTANQYITFWNILSSSNQSNQDALSQLNSIGSKIKNNLDKVNKIYDKMIKIKPYNTEIILDYSYFNSYILNDEDKAKVFNNQLRELTHSSTISIDENDLCHLDLNKLSSVNDYYYVIFSGSAKDVGIITHISIPICSLFGYRREELIGYPIEKLMPELYNKIHKNSILRIVESYKRKMFDDMNTYHNFRIEFLNTDTYAVNKSGYLIPLHYKGAFFPNDNGNCYFFLKIIIDSSSSAMIYSQNISYILTDRHLVIQHFSANATNLLGFSSDTLHSPKEITSHIKQLQEDFMYCFINDQNDNANVNGSRKRNTSNAEERRLELKCKLVKGKYSTPTPIAWVSNNVKCNNFNQNEANCKSNPQDTTSSNFISPVNSIRKSRMMSYEDNFMLSVDDYGDFGEKVGFIFKLEPLWYFRLKENNNSVKGISSKDIIRSVKSKKLLYNEDDPSTIMNRLRMGSRDSSYLNAPLYKIANGFLPELNLKFAFDPKMNTYYQSNSDQSQLKSNKHLMYIKQQAENKCNMIKNIKETGSLSSEEVSGSYSLSSSQSDNDYSSSSVGVSVSDQEDNKQKKGQGKGQGQVKLKETFSHYDYYHVDLTKIKYSIYDYNKKQSREQSEYVKISEIEYKLSKECNNNENKTPDSNETDIAQINGKNGNTRGMKGTPTKDGKPLYTLTDSHKEKIKEEMKSAFKKDNVQHTILVLYILSLTTFILAIIKESIFLFHYLTFIDVIENYVTLIRSTYKINRNVLHGIYSLRELLLTNFDFYQVPFEEYTKEEFIDIHLKNLEYFFTDNDAILSNIMKNPVQIAADKKNEINEIAGHIFFIQSYNNYSIGNNTNTFISACFAVNYALEHIIHTPLNKLYPTNEDVFLFTFTALNSLWPGLIEQNESYKLVFRTVIDELYYKQIILFLCLESLMAICYFTSRVGLKRVSDQNESYLSVYFSINKEIITTSLVKCEKFMFQFQTNTIKDKFHDEIDENREDLSSTRMTMNNDSDNIHNEHNNDNKGVVGITNIGITYFNPISPLQNKINSTNNNNDNIINTNKTVYIDASCSKKFRNKFKCLGQFFIGYMIILVGSMIVLLFDGLLLSFLFQMEKRITYSITVYEGEASIEKYTVLIYDLLRESVFDRNALFLLEPLKDSIGTLITDVYNTIQLKKQKAEDSIHYVSSLYDLYYTINFKSICNTTDEDKCIENSSGSALYGLKALIMYFIEEVRGLHYTDVNLKIMNKKFNFTYNFTLFGTDDYERYFPTNPGLLALYHKVGPMNIFNSLEHKKVSYIYWYMLYPKFQLLITTIGGNIIYDCVFSRNFYIISLSSFMAFIVFLIFFIWFPYVHQLNLLIYKTKNMLSIIPIEVLLSVSNINTLLEINKDFDQLYKQTNTKITI